MDPIDVVRLLCKAESFNIDFRKMLGPMYRVDIDSHSTATHLEIHATIHDETLLVYYKTLWFSQSYEFNEKGRTIGFQHTGPWVSTINSWLEQVDIKVAEVISKSKQASIDKQNKTQVEIDQKIDRFRKSFGGNISYER